MTHRTLTRALAAAAGLALLAFGSSAQAAGSGLQRGTATIATTPTGFSGDGGTYDNAGGDEVTFGVRGPFPSNYFYLLAGGPKSDRFTTVQGTHCEKTVFTVTSTTAPDWFTDGGTSAVPGRARLLCDRADRTRLEYRWGYVGMECVLIERNRADRIYTFTASESCPATIGSSNRGAQDAVTSAGAVPFVVTGKL